MAIWDKINKVTGTVNGFFSGTPDDEAGKTIHDEFIPTLGFTGKRTTFAEHGLIYGSETYPYAQLHPIQLVNKPSSQVMQGVAQTLTESGKSLTMVFSYNQTERFLKALNYANEQISLAHGTAVNYKYLLQSIEGSKLEVYEDYVQLYHLPNGAKNLLSNSMGTGGTTFTLDFSDISIALAGVTEENRCRVVVQYGGENYALDLNIAEQGMAEEAIAYISDHAKVGTVAAPEPEMLKETWQPETGIDRRFTLCGKVLEIPASMDLLNSYRKKFSKLASECADCARSEYNRKVRDLSTYMDVTPGVYGYYTAAVASKAMEILVAEGIWSVTNNSLIEEHTARHHYVMDHIKSMAESMALTAQNNQSAISNVMGYVPHLRGGGFGLKGAAKGIATATAFNVARDSLESGLAKGAVNLNQAQRIELYNRVKPDVLFEDMYVDFSNLYLIMIEKLINNGKKIWLPSSDATRQAENIFCNLSNPAFPKDKVVEVFLSILKTNPYRKEYFQFMMAHFGETPETIAIRDYFGYTDLNNPRTK